MPRPFACRCNAFARVILIIVASTTVALGMAFVANADEPRFTEQQYAELDQRDQLSLEARKLIADGKLTEGLATYERALAITLQLRPADHYESLDLVTKLCWLSAAQGDLVAAQRWAEQASKAQAGRLDRQDWRVKSAGQLATFVARAQGLSSEDFSKLHAAIVAEEKMDELGVQEKLSEATPLARQSSEAFRGLCGEDSPEYVNSLFHVAWVLRSGKDQAAAQAAAKTLVERCQSVLGENHPDYGLSLICLGFTRYDMRDYPSAEKLFRQAAEIYRRSQGEMSSGYTTAQNNLAEIYISTKDYPRAQAILEEVLDIRTRAKGANHRDLARCLRTLARVHELKHDYQQALSILERTQQILTAHRMSASPDEIDCLWHMASCQEARGQFDEALALDQRVLEMQKENVGPETWQVGYALQRISGIYGKQGDYQTALQYQRQVLQVFETVFGKQSDQYSSSRSEVVNLLNALNYTAEQRADFDAARKACAEALTMMQEAYGDHHWRTRDAQDQVALADRLAAMSEEQRAQFWQVQELYQTADQLRSSHPRDALVPAEKALAICQSLFGEEDWNTLSSLFQVSSVYFSMGDYDHQAPLVKRLPELCRRVRGMDHPDYAISLHNLGSYYRSIGDMQQAQETFEAALPVVRAVFGEPSAELANAIHGLAGTSTELGKFGKAESLYKQAIVMRKEMLGVHHPDYARSLMNMGFFYVKELDDGARAEPLLREAAAIYRAAFGPRHPEYARAIDFLATAYTHLSRYEEAEALYKEALEIRREVLGNAHRDVHITTHNLGVLYLGKKDYARAVELLTASLETPPSDAVFEHPDDAFTYTEIGRARRLLGQFAEAQNADEKALQIRRAALGADHPDYAVSLSRVGVDRALLDDAAAGLPMTLEALRISQQRIRQNAGVQSERQQLAARTSAWGLASSYLFVSRLAGAAAEQVYANIVPYKGMVGARQRKMRELRHRLKESGNQHVAQLATRLDESVATLSRLTHLPVQGNRERDFQIKELSERVETLQKELADSDPEFRAQFSQQERTVKDVSQSLPPQSVLVDFYAYDHTGVVDGAAQWQSELVAFVIFPGGSVRRIEFGATSPIEAAIANWRKQYGVKTSESDPGAELRKLLWLPLQSELRDAKTVLISPNGLLAPLPWAALPGSTPNSYLIDEIAVAVVPIPSLLSELATPTPPAALPQLLLVGDVDFGAAPGKVNDLAALDRGRPSGDFLHSWQPLPGTGDEVRAIANEYASVFAKGRPEVLTGAEPTKNRIREQVGKFEYLHFCTHGFFAPPQSAGSTAAAGSDVKRPGGEVNPGLLSGLVLAGANHPPEAGQDDGILTAIEVEELDLGQVQLATLSACETGLGESAGGEGLLGLQRAFQTAGAKSVVAGLWKVPDRATQVLMTHFYTNLWQRKLSKLEALREAQRWMLHEGTKDAGLTRGLDIPEPSQPDADTHLLAPYYWAAFVLSGDWR